MLPKSLAFVDIETSGSSPQRDKVIEIGVVLVDSGQVTNTWHTLLNPQQRLHPFISGMTGIQASSLVTAPVFSQIAPELSLLLKDRLFVAHNVGFDYSFLKAEFSRLDQLFKPQLLCSLNLSRRLFPRFKRHGLDALINRYHFTATKRHRALNDAQIIWQFYQHMLLNVDESRLASTITQLSKHSSLPANLLPSQTADLPQSPGVYLLYGENDQLLYIGKSVNIKQRVLSHFYAAADNLKELLLKNRLNRIETITTSGELQALLLESQLIKLHQPLYNRRLRYYRTLTAIKSQTNPDGYQTLTTSTVKHLYLSDLQNLILVARTKASAKKILLSLAKEHQLCPKLLGLEKSNSSCFAYHLKECSGACLKLETPTNYNLRLSQALSQMSLKAWPFEGAIALTESNPQTKKTAIHLFYRWCYLGSVKEFNQISAKLTRLGEVIFDLDTYNILAKHLLTKPTPLGITVIPVSQYGFS